jgi:hypothetical protein
VLYLSVHVSSQLAQQIQARPALRRHLQRHGPIGCRDWATARRLATLSVPTYFSGCLTLQLRAEQVEPSIECLAVDADPPPDVIVQCLSMTNAVPSKYAYTAQHIAYRRELARQRLRLFGKARTILTNRLHVYLPCIAMGLPVHIANRAAAAGSDRFEGLLDLAPGRLQELKELQEMKLREFLRL